MVSFTFSIFHSLLKHSAMRGANVALKILGPRCKREKGLNFPASPVFGLLERKAAERAQKFCAAPFDCPQGRLYGAHFLSHDFPALASWAHPAGGSKLSVINCLRLTSSESEEQSFMAKALRLIKILAAFCVAFLLALPLWNLAVTNWQHAHNPVPGNFYSVNGRQMHIYCSGAGSPTVVIETGASASWLGWQGVQPQLAQVTRVCTYDRAGHGWSEPRPGPRDAETTVRELHGLLDQAGVQRPLVLAGHSLGGLLVREYAREFPAEVVGAVLIDSSFSPAAR
jgi:hypothetical protein